MPFTRITLRQGRAPAFIQDLSSLLQQNLVAWFDVPPGDCFQVIDQVPPESLVVDRDYICGPRSEDFILLQIIAGRRRDLDTQRMFYRRLTETLEQKLHVRPQDVMIVITLNRPQDWSFGGGAMFAPP
ncbi:tautomerase family protein [Sodalis sp. RH21]|uniref:tautomerase family protein n=1 Tax=unclassified Sodalis (in: enterobacteria) TaxID=2636512 RepID=UPI0039B37007